MLMENIYNHIIYVYIYMIIYDIYIYELSFHMLPLRNT